MSNSFYITTPLYYVNAKPHLGHAYTTIAADVMRRFHMMLGSNTFFTTGTDEHGDKIVRAANREKKTPRNYVDEISSIFKKLWPEFNISNDKFIRTTDSSHVAVVTLILQRIYDSGDIYFSEYEGKYCFECERFYNDRELKNGNCPDHNIKPAVIKESNYFFKMSKYQEWLVKHIKNNNDFIRPKQYKNEVLALLREPLEDLCISRPKSRIMWGIDLPFDKRYVTYVWFDALLNYISALGYPSENNYSIYWSGVQHIIAKDILKPHGIYWPIILKAANIPIYKHLNVHGYWKLNKYKMSKSIGNIIDPFKIKETYGVDALRFFLMREMVFGLDSTFSEANIEKRVNSDLANDLGNLFSRVLSMIHKYFNGIIPKVKHTTRQEFDMGLEGMAQRMVKDFKDYMNIFAFHKALSAIWIFIGQMNKYVDLMSPWILAKNDLMIEKLKAVMCNLLEGLRFISILIYPVMPNAARKMQYHLAFSTYSFSIDELEIWRNPKAGLTLPKTVSIFPRVESENLQNKFSKNIAVTTFPIKSEITMKTFNKIDLRVAKIVSVENITGSEKLLKIKASIGIKELTIVSSISQTYNLEQLIGHQVVVVANLKPVKFMGVRSDGMLIAALNGKNVSLPILDKLVKTGSQVK